MPYAALKNRLYNWLFQPRGAQAGPVVLVQRRVFILPTRQGLGFAAVLLLMLAGSVNYNLSLGFVLTFLLGAMGITTMLHSFRNLANLRLSAGRTQPVFAGSMARFTVCIENTGDSDRYGIGLARSKLGTKFVDAPARQTVFVGIDIPALHRGLLPPGRLTLFTRYPLGLYYAWAYFEPAMQCLVYPRPAPPALPLPAMTRTAGQGTQHGQGQEDFSGLRQYHPGDSSRHIAWKAVARDQGLLTKQFSGRADSELWLSWEQLPPHMGPEEKLSQLTRWVLDADAIGLSFGLELPGDAIPVASGEAQRERCLEALALFDVATLKGHTTHDAGA
jgi:uncharacterized protein (DUF58 family)